MSVVVAGHICLDITPDLSHHAMSLPELMTPGNMIIAGPALLSGGGVVSNVGIALHRLGVPVRLMARIGGDPFGRVLLDILTRCTSPSVAAGIREDPQESTAYTLVLSAPGFDRAFVHCPGTNDNFDSHDIDYDAVASARIFHFGYPPIMRRFYRNPEEARAMFASVRDRGVVTCLDMTQPDADSEAGSIDWRAWLRRVLPYVDLFVPSEAEIRFMLPGSGDAASIADGLIGMGAAVVMMKRGLQGILLKASGDRDALERIGVPRWRNADARQPCFAVEPNGTTGAGDAAVAGFLAAFLARQEPSDAAASAAAAGAASVESPLNTAGVPPFDELQRRIASGWPVMASPADVSA